VLKKDQVGKNLVLVTEQGSQPLCEQESSIRKDNLFDRSKVVSLDDCKGVHPEQF